MLKLPVFLDSIGTLLVALLAGPLAAMTTGLVTNLIWGLITSPVAAAFAPHCTAEGARFVRPMHVRLLQRQA